MEKLNQASRLHNRRLATGLLLLRLGIGIVFLMWTIDKFVNPGHAAAVFENFYKIPSLAASASYLIGGAQLILISAFIAGAFRRYTYGIVFVLHAVSTVSSYAKYFDPWTGPNLLFFAALPMLAACWMLWSLRESDTLLSFDELLQARRDSR